jgi:rhamnogalacturonan endolyase
MWKDALAKAAKEAGEWPYGWVHGVDYPHKDARGAVSGQLMLNDPVSPDARMKNILVGLAAPDYKVNGRGGETTVDWQLDAKHYEFWVRADEQGRFSIPNVRPGTYTLHAIADGVLGEYAKTDVAVGPGKPLDLGRLEWKPTHYGKPLWQIGVPDRTAAEFRHGDHYWQWGLYNEYAKEFPNDVHFVVGKSDVRKDWNYAQLPHDGKATTWTIEFDLPEAPRGKATLRLALAANSARRIDVGVNGQPAGSTGALTDTATIRRDGIRGYWSEKDVSFDAAMLKAGTNLLTLTIPAGGVMSGVEYDCVRLEVEPLP